MSSTRLMRAADPVDVVQAITFALLHRGRKRVHDAAEMAARITAERLAEHLARCGFVIMHKEPAPLGPDDCYAPSLERVIRGE